MHGSMADFLWFEPEALRYYFRDQPIWEKSLEQWLKWSTSAFKHYGFLQP